MVFIYYAAGFLSKCHFHWNAQDLPRIRKTVMYASVGGSMQMCVVIYIEWVNNKHAIKHNFPMVPDLSSNVKNGTIRKCKKSSCPQYLYVPSSTI